MQVGLTFNSSYALCVYILRMRVRVPRVGLRLYLACFTLVPLRKSSVEKKKWYKDQTLSRLASLKKAAWDRWSANGRPKEGPQ